MLTKKEQLFEYISEKISALAIAGYLKEEAIACLKYLHQYKLERIEKNLTSLCDYLIFLNEQNTEKFLDITKECEKSSRKSPHDLSYFFSPKKKLSVKATREHLQKISEQSYQLLNLMQGIRGILILTIDEFCNATPTRMAIYEMLRSDHVSEKKSSKKVKTKK